jgi:Zn-dependent protease with chaperone function
MPNSGSRRWAVATIASMIAICAPLRVAAQDINALHDAIGRSIIASFRERGLECRTASIDSLNERIFATLIKRGSLKNSPQVFIFNLPKANAYAIPGDRIIFTSKMLQFIGNIEEYVGILMHEVGHVVHQHTRSHLIAGTARWLFFGDGAAGGLGLLALLKFSRVQEEEADEFAVSALANLGLKATGLSAVLKRMSSRSTDTELTALLSDHPTTAAREARLRQLELSTPTKHEQIALPNWTALQAVCGGS